MNTGSIRVTRNARYDAKESSTGPCFLSLFTNPDYTHKLSMLVECGEAGELGSRTNRVMNAPLIVPQNLE